MGLGSAIKHRTIYPSGTSVMLPFLLATFFSAVFIVFRYSRLLGVLQGLSVYLGSFIQFSFFALVSNGCSCLSVYLCVCVCVLLHRHRHAQGVAYGQCKEGKTYRNKKKKATTKKSLIGETRAESAHRLRLGGCQSHDATTTTTTMSRRRCRHASKLSAVRESENEQARERARV